MPESIVGELILEPLAEIALQIVGYFTGKIVVSAFSFGRAYVEPKQEGVRIVIPKWHGFNYCSDGKIVVTAEMGALIGFLFWIFIIFLYFRFWT
jgi:hypothetical protein